MRKHMRSVRLRILWEYAKLITCSRLDLDMGRVDPAPSYRRNEYWALVTSTFNKLEAGHIHPSSILRENKLLVSKNDLCAYCGCQGKLEWEHIIARSEGGPDTIDNMVRACVACNQSKGATNVRNWCNSRDVGVPRLVLGKYLKLLFDAHKENGSLEWPSYPKDQEMSLDLLAQVFDP